MPMFSALLAYIEHAFEDVAHDGRNRRRPMNRNAEIPPAGPDLPLDDWARAVAERVRKYLPDVGAAKAGRVITWRRGTAVATLDAGRLDWRLQINSSNLTGTGIACHSNRHDRFTAGVAASNIVVHFDIRYCRGLDVPPYSEREINTLLGKK